MHGIAGARNVTVSGDGGHVYVARSAGISVFSREPGTGLLTFVEEETAATAQAAEATPPARVRKQPNSRHYWSVASSCS